MFTNTKISKIALAVALSVGISTAAMAQETSSAITGVITGPQGNPAAGTVVTITHVPSGSTRTTTVGSNGQFSAKGLRVGGPYRIAFDSDRFKDQTIDGVFLQLGESPTLDLALQSNSDIEVISVTGGAIAAVEFGNTSPGSVFNLTDLEQAASADRDIKDLVRIDPRINIEESDGEEAIICGGNNPRFSSLTVDGVRMNDSFGLNFNGYPTTRMPFSFDSIDQVAVELAPFDVQFGGFTACNINAVTKSGTNEIHGGMFYDFTSDSLTGDKIDGQDVDTGSFTEKRYGINFGLPLIKDTLFFYTSYEKLDGVQLFQYDALGNQISQAELDRAIQITKDVYDYDPGGMPTSMPVSDEKLLLKLDWNINDDHRASLVYNYNDGFRLDQSDARSDTITLSNHFYEVGAKLNSVVASVYSDWTENFSTEVRLGHIKLDNRQQSLDAASGFGEIQIGLNGATIFIGPDDSRQSNKLSWENLTFKAAGTYYLDDHTITFGYERENLEVFNLFMQHTVGEYRFGNDFSRQVLGGIPTLDDYEIGRADDIYYNNSAGTNNPDDAAAAFEYATNAVYIQDKWVMDDLTLMVGLRYDWYTSSDEPRQNDIFEARYGYSNTATLDGKDLLQPRVGFNYAINDALELRGGIGLYSGGNPNVWVSNSYSNDGITNIDTYRGGTDLLDSEGNVAVALAGGDDARLIYNPLQSMFDEVADNDPSLGDEPSVNAIDPDFEIPSEWKYNLGFTYETANEYVIQGDILYAKKKDNAIIRAASWDDASRTELFDGRAVYDYVTVGQRENGSDITRSFRKSDLVLTNAEGEGDSTTISVAVRKEYDFGLTANVGYAYNESTDITPMTSAVSFSNFTSFATTDAQNPGVSTSNYEVPHRFTFNLRYSNEYINGYRTSFSLFGSRTKGRPISYTFDELSVGATEFESRRHLLYVPLENDPNVIYGENFDQAAFNAFVDAKGLTRGEIVDRNSHNSAWHTRVDFRIDQELPAFAEGHKARAFFVIKNLGNLLNDEWGVKTVGNFVAQNVVTASINDEGQYEFSDFREGNAEETTFIRQSLWEVRVGVKYTF
jgi:hypothetical protein